MAKRESTMYTIKTVTAHEIVDWASQGRLDIPEFQRDFVWKPQDVKHLADSLYRDYPIGSFLLWRTSLPQQPRRSRSSTPEIKRIDKNQKPFWIVDGQQRITALCLLLGRRPSWWLNSHSWNDLVERVDIRFTIKQIGQDVEVEFALLNPTHCREGGWFSLRKLINGEEDEEKIVKELSRKIGSQQLVRAELQRLLAIRDRKIPCSITKHTIDDVAEIFTRSNQAGKRVKEADVILALSGVYNPTWISEEYLSFREKIGPKGWMLESGIIIRTLTCIGEGKANLSKVKRSFWMPKNMNKYWNKTKSVIIEVLQKLRDYGIASDRILPSTNSLIPLFVLHYEWRGKRGYRFCKALHWFLLANKVGRYSGSAITRINEDVKAIRESKNFDEALEKLYKHFRSEDKRIHPDDFQGRYDTADNRFFRLMLYMVLFHRRACDWDTENEIKKFLYNSEELHHIYPRDILKREGVEDAQINSLANITVLEKETNKKISNQKPSEYLKRVKKQHLEAHCVPTTCSRRVPLRDEYDMFLRKRSQLLARFANELLKGLESGNPRPRGKRISVRSVHSNVGSRSRAKGK